MKANIRLDGTMYVSIVVLSFSYFSIVFVHYCILYTSTYEMCCIMCIFTCNNHIYNLVCVDKESLYCCTYSNAPVKPVHDICVTDFLFLFFS